MKKKATAKKPVKRKVSFTKKGKRVSRDSKHISDGFYSYNYDGYYYIYDDNGKVHYKVVEHGDMRFEEKCSRCNKKVMVTYCPVQPLNKLRKIQDEVIIIKIHTCHMPTEKNLSFMSKNAFYDYYFNYLPEVRLRMKMHGESTKSIKH